MDTLNVDKAILKLIILSKPNICPEHAFLYMKLNIQGPAGKPNGF
jgi:hypothetical protein